MLDGIEPYMLLLAVGYSFIFCASSVWAFYEKEIGLGIVDTMFALFYSWLFLRVYRHKKNK
jgi:hypothetical protein